MDQNAKTPDRLSKALIHDLRGLLSPIFTICQERTLFGPPDPEESAEEYRLFLQAAGQMNELLNSWNLAFCSHAAASPEPINALAAVSTAGTLLKELIPEDCRPRLELPEDMPNCIGHELKLRQIFSDALRFLAGLGAADSMIVVSGSSSENQAVYAMSMSGLACSESEITDYLHTSEEQSRHRYALVGARLMLEQQGGQLCLTSSQEEGTVIRITMPC